MFQWTTALGGGPRLMMLVHHDDGRREYAYGPAGGLPDTKVGTFPQALMDQAKKSGWHVISMKNDWKRLFPFDRIRHDRHEGRRRRTSAMTANGLRRFISSAGSRS